MAAVCCALRHERTTAKKVATASVVVIARSVMIPNNCRRRAPPALSHATGGRAVVGRMGSDDGGGTGFDVPGDQFPTCGVGGAF